MDPSSFLKDKQRRQMRSARMKIIVMAIVLVALVGVIFEFGPQGLEALFRRADPSVSTEEVVGQQEAGPLPRGESPDFGKAPAEGKTLAIDPKEVEQNYPFMTDPKTLEQIEDQDVEVEPGPFFFMLHRVAQEKPEAIAADAAPLPDWDTLWQKAGTVRGKAFAVKGTIVSIWRQPLGKNPMKLDEAWAYRIRAHGAALHDKGNFYDVYAIEKLKGALVRDDVTVHARFLKAQTSEPERIEDPEFHVAVFIARRFEPLTYLDAETIPTVVDGNRPEARAFYWLLKRAREIPFAELQTRSKANAKLTYLDFVNRPERYRAKAVVVRGELRRLIRITLPENLLGVPDIFYGQIADTDRKINTFYCINVPEGIHLKDPVLLHGFFLKKWAYISEGGHEVNSPIFIVKQMQTIEYAGEDDYTMELLIGAVILVTAIIVGVVLVNERKRDRTRAEERRQRQLARIPDDLDDRARKKAAAARGEDA